MKRREETGKDEIHGYYGAELYCLQISVPVSELWYLNR